MPAAVLTGKSHRASAGPLTPSNSDARKHFFELARRPLSQERRFFLLPLVEGERVRGAQDGVRLPLEHAHAGGRSSALQRSFGTAEFAVPWVPTPCSAT